MGSLWDPWVVMSLFSREKGAAPGGSVAVFTECDLPSTIRQPISQPPSAQITLAKDPTIFVYIATDTSSKCQCIQLLLLNVLAGGKGSRRRNQKLIINIVGFCSRYTYHGLLVVQGSISIAYWSSQPSVPQHTTTPPGPPLLPRCVFLLGLAAFGSVRSYIFDYTARRAGGQPCRAIA